MKIKVLNLYLLGYFPEGIFPMVAIPNSTISQSCNFPSDNLQQVWLDLLRCHILQGCPNTAARMSMGPSPRIEQAGGRALQIEQTKGRALQLGKTWEVPLGKLLIWEVFTWENTLLVSCRSGKSLWVNTQHLFLGGGRGVSK